MSGDHLKRPLILLLLIGGCCAVLKKPITRALYDGDTLQLHLSNDDDIFIQQITIAPNSKVTLNITNVSSSTSFIIAQVHAFQYRVTLSYDKDHLHVFSNRSVFGSNIGLFIPINSSTVLTQLYLGNDNVHTVQAIVASIAYNSRAPIPGGCNMEFNTKIAPYAKVQLNDTMIIVDTQPASTPDKTACEKNAVQHTMYQMYLTEQDYSAESYFASIVNMLTVDDIMQNGKEVPNHNLLTPMRNIFNAYTGTGSVYVRVATYKDVSAAYIPAFSQGCDPAFDPDSCQVLTSSSQKFVCACCFFLGLLSVFFGHYCLVVDQNVPMLFFGTTVTYIFTLNIGWAILGGVAITSIWQLTRWFHWLCFDRIVFNTSLGFFVACITYFGLSDSLAVVHNDAIFDFLFATIVLSTSIIMLMMFSVDNVITCAIYSSFMMVLPLDYYFGSCLKYIIINVIRRATVEGFNNVILLPPIQGTDIALFCVWAILGMYRILVQFIPNRIGCCDLLKIFNAGKYMPLKP